MDCIHAETGKKTSWFFSNNYLTFYCRNVQKLTDADIDEYFQKLETPGDHMFFADVIKNNIRKIKKEDQDIVKFFSYGFSGTL